MTDSLDRMTEDRVERSLMEQIRGGHIPASEIAAHVPAFFLKLQVQTVSPCNAACAMCPWPETKDTQPQGVMDDATFDAILTQITGRGVQRVSLFLMNEPLLDRKLEQKTAALKTAAPEVCASIFTNGTLLDGDRVRALARSGMDEISISINGFDRDTYERYMRGIDYDTVMANLREVAAARRTGDLGETDVRLVGLDMPGTREGAEAFYAETELPFFLKPVTNRAGSVDADSFREATLLADHTTACQRPFVKAYVLYNGDMVLCNCDWERTTIIGNVLERPLDELWHDAALTEIRRWHVDGAFPSDSLCASCDYRFTI